MSAQSATSTEKKEASDISTASGAKGACLPAPLLDLPRATTPVGLFLWAALSRPVADRLRSGRNK